MKKSLAVLTALVLPSLALVSCSSGTSRASVGSQPVAVQGAGSSLVTRDTYASSDAVEGSLSEVWAALPRVYEALEIPITLRNNAEFLIGNRNLQVRSLDGERISHWIYCGRHPTTGRALADVYDVTMSVRTELRVSPAEEGMVLVESWVEGSARNRGASGNPVNCTTESELEPRIRDLLLIELAKARAGGSEGLPPADPS